jgi:hypothetical protein
MITRTGVPRETANRKLRECEKKIGLTLRRGVKIRLFSAAAGLRMLVVDRPAA